MYRDQSEAEMDDKRDLIWCTVSNVQLGDVFRVFVVRHFEGVPHPAFAPFLATNKVMPDQKTLEEIDRIASIHPDLLTVPPSELESTFNAVREELGYLAEGGMADNMTKTQEAMTRMAQYEAEADVQPGAPR
jgi:hypothetical protein